MGLCWGLPQRPLKPFSSSRIASRSNDKDGDSVHTASDVPLTPRTNSPDGRRSSSDTSKSTYSLTRRISSKCLETVMVGQGDGERGILLV